jgi:hypothetical protein
MKKNKKKIRKKYEKNKNKNRKMCYLKSLNYVLFFDKLYNNSIVDGVLTLL